MKPKNIETIAGLDIGTSSIKFVEVVHADGGFELRQASILPAAGDADVRAAIQKLALGPRVRTSLSGTSVITRAISMPTLSPRELSSAIRFEAESHIPFSIDDCSIDYQVIRQDAASKQMLVLVAVAKRDVVEARWKMLSELGVRPEIVDLDVFCIVNAFEALHSGETDKSYGILNIGHSLSSLAIMHEGIPLFTREIAHGGSQVTRVLAEARGITEAQAEEMKVKAPTVESESLRAAAEKGLESLAEEVRHSVDYFETEHKTDLKKVYLSGGGALVSGAAEVLSQEVGKTFAFWDNTKKLKIAPEAKSVCTPESCGRFDVALGMALRGNGGRK